MGGRGASSSTGKTIPQSIYNQWRTASDKYEAGRKIAFNDVSQWSTMSDAGNDFVTENAKISKMAFKRFAKGFTYNENSQKASKKLADGSSIIINGVSSNHGMVLVDTQKGFNLVNRQQFDKWEDAYKYANTLS